MPRATPTPAAADDGSSTAAAPEPSMTSVSMDVVTESSFDARRAAPLLLSQVAALHALRRLWHGYTGCASLGSVCQRNGCAKVVMRC